HAFDAGVADFIAKPIHLPLLLHKIDYMLRASEDHYAMAQSEEYLMNLFQSLPLGYQSLDEEGNFLDVNPAWSSITGFKKEDVVGKPFIDYLHADSVHTFLNHFFSIFKGETSTNIPFQMVRNDGAIIDVEFSGQISKDKQGTFLQTHCLIVDITMRKIMEDKLIKMATLDGLTEVFNRRAFMERADDGWKQSSRYYRPLSTLMIDIDFFKGINDTHGHATGDRVLKDVANTCQQVLRETDSFGRIGGEEFAVLLPETEQKEALLSAERIREAIENLSFIEKNNTFSITVSIGLAQRQPKDESFELLLHRADEALYQAKESGRNRVEISQ
ncbi:MAG: sensor domain-containing diguanylate cyclase, partial [Ghiorsea sp.]